MIGPIIVLTAGMQGPPGIQGTTGTSVSSLTLEAGETLNEGDPVYVSANKFYKSSNLNSAGVTGIISTGAAIALPATATLSGIVTAPGLVDGSPYFLGDKVISVSAPSSGYVVRIGKALNSSKLLINIEEPILLT